MARSQRSFGSRSSRPKAWEVLGGQAVALNQNAGVVAAGLSLERTYPRTVVRIRGQIYSSIAAAEASGDLVMVTLGIRVVSVDDVTDTSVSPFSDGEAPWMYWQSWALEVGADPAARTVRIPVDVKAMRKLSPDQVLGIVVENTTVGTAAASDTVLTARMLYQS